VAALILETELIQEHAVMAGLGPAVRDILAALELDLTLIPKIHTTVAVVVALAVVAVLPQTDDKIIEALLEAIK
jgi:hypothetical protein